ncbi:integrase domain-containing protein [Paraburkholderia sp. CNPSo 3274]|uniref:integrase domain-containing protein n=1 Tax=unclassified Paraburkholderia TaxID=2615204 RepID=UPI0020B89CBB|nr:MULTISPECIES: integrase domain-containing protein [unclassified Paraburkholderia]MCP3712279.1 integrase domain-containing protein [Paraburkholderia sp. CNPSo 3274]MCP3718494.1 integrase domain-containing protein [Paraburkholderia sp. CNPSo 3281]
MAAILNVRAVVRGYRLTPAIAQELIDLFDEHVATVHSRTRVSGRSLSIKTQEHRVRAICVALVELRGGGFAVTSPWNLRQKHIEWLVRRWVDAKQSGGTIENKLTYLRTLAGWMKKEHLVGTLANYADRKANGLERSYVAEADKSWSGNGINATEKIAEIATTCPRVAVQLKLQAAFGLRISESFLLRPAEAVKDIENLGVTRGTKGGRERKVRIEDQLAVLEEAAQLANPMTGSTIPADRTLKQWVDRYKTVLRKHGVNKKGLGVTSHGLRHQYLQELYERASGVPAPVKLAGTRPDPEVHKEAMRRVVEAAGHSRVTKANAYLSTFARQERLAKPSPTVEEAAKALEAAGGNKTHAARSLGISRQALYRLLGNA